MAPPQAPALPAPEPEALAISEALRARIAGEIDASGGWISFSRYMALALYAPGLGYYSAGSTKLGASGDFVTAPELSPLFGRCLARQVSELLARGLTDIIEPGAGTGALAAELLRTLERLGTLPRRYRILDLSADLRARQRERIATEVPHLLDRVEWLDTLPERIEGILIANEVLDAMPVNVVRTHAGGIDEIGVALEQQELVERERPAAGALLRAAHALDLPAEYETEVHLAARAFIAAIGERMTGGVALLIDYGFPRAEYYHPQRARGTLMCHYRHHAHTDPFALVGLQDITAHIDFTAIADAGLESGLSVLGYTAQAQFLVNCGITEILGETSPADVRAYAPLAAQAQKLLSPAEMGELFKVIALGRGIDAPLVGFARGDRTHTL